jgi:glycosyltransferase involved in cell wall biosynthesis
VETSYSDVELSDSAFRQQPRPAAPAQNTFRLIMVGSLRQLYKAPHILLEAVSICIKQYNLNLELVIVGDGQYREQLEEQAAALGLAQRVHFTGQLVVRDEVIVQLDQADLFVLPSLTEGLPRAMIEAMARALPCIGSAVGGIPELLSSENLVPPGDITALSAKICDVVTNPARMACMSAANLNKARTFHEESLRERRTRFYQYIKEQTKKWLNHHQS